MESDKLTLKIGAGKAGPGRGKGTPNRTTALLKDAILLAVKAAGGKGGMVGYLTLQAMENPGPFMALLGKVLPTQMTGPDDGPVQVMDVTAASILEAKLNAITSRTPGIAE